MANSNSYLIIFTKDNILGDEWGKSSSLPTQMSSFFVLNQFVNR